MDNWKTIEPNVWKPQMQGDCIVGVLVNKVPKDENTGLSAKYQLENEDGMFLIWGGAVLDDRMQYVNIGSKIRITSDGRIKTCLMSDKTYDFINHESLTTALNQRVMPDG